MKGTAILLGLDALPPEVREFRAPPTLEYLQDAVGGHSGNFIEAVPRFKTINHAGAKHACVAFCNEDGKRLKLPINRRATLLWREANPALLDERGNWTDVLVGPVIVLYGDAEFMEAL